MNAKQIYEGYTMTQIKLIDMKATSSEMTYIYIYIYISKEELQLVPQLHFTKGFTKKRKLNLKQEKKGKSIYRKSNRKKQSPKFDFFFKILFYF